MTDYIGRTIGEYQLIELLAEDEHTLQIKAFQPGEERYVNFTMLKPHAVKDGLFVQQFLNAAEIASKLGHPNILPVLDFGQQESTVFRVSPLTESGTVRDHRGWFYDLHNANQLLSQVIDGLAYIYTHGHIHGNLKSSNIFLNADLRPLLAGFGITQPPGHAENPYLSPEQIQGGVIDQRSDVYALGVLLYELLTGVTPPVGIVVKPSSMRQDLPPAVDQVVLKAMAQNPEQRFESPVDFRRALQIGVDHPDAAPAVSEAPPTPPAPGVSQSVNVQQPPKRTNWTAIILGIVLVGVIIGGAFLILPPLFDDDGDAEVPTEPPVEQPTEPPVEQPTEPPVEQPPEPTAEEPEIPGGLPDFCYSIVGAAGLAVFGITAAAKKRQREIFYGD